jgi:hypothetical protein
MAMKRSQHSHQQGRELGIVLQRLLLVFMLLCVVGITISALIIAQRFWNIFIPEPHPTATPIVVVSPSPTQKQTPSPTSTPTPTPTQGPSPTPTQAPGVLGYPLYGGNIHRPEIALTFDDGPNPPYTSQILTILHTYGVKATFFVIGTNAATYPNLVRTHRPFMESNEAEERITPFSFLDASLCSCVSAAVERGSRSPVGISGCLDSTRVVSLFFTIAITSLQKDISHQKA